MATETDKLILTHRSSLQTKYGKDFKRIIKKVKEMIASDKKKKQVITKLIYVDDPALMKKCKSPVVKQADANDPGAFKKAIDGLYAFFKPDYLMILGAGDIVPHCRFRRFTDDDDVFVDSDLPYACSAPFSRDPGDFIAPGRVLGRLPDISGVKDTAYILRLLDNAIRWKPISHSRYERYFAISVKWWAGSTRQSLENMFGNKDRLLLAPPAEGPYKKSQLAVLTHFFNCHGASGTPEFYGQPSKTSNQFPVCFHSDHLVGKITYGTVVAAECCYGGMLYNPVSPEETAIPICNSYLGQNALGYVGSTTIAYGPSDGQGAADLLTQFFIRSVLKGASLGRAFLEAQQRYVEVAPPKLDPIDLKTLIQFLLLGDPSNSPVAEMPKTTPGKSAVKAIENVEKHMVVDRKIRRESMAKKSGFIRSNSDAPRKSKNIMGAPVKKEIEPILEKYNYSGRKPVTYGFRRGKQKTGKGILPAPEFRYHLYTKRDETKQIPQIRVLVIQEVNKKIMEVKEYVRK